MILKLLERKSVTILKSLKIQQFNRIPIEKNENLKF